MSDEKIVEECKEAFLTFIDESSSFLDKNSNVFDERKDLINNIDVNDNEKIRCVAPIHTGNWGITRSGLLIATNTRIFVLFKQGIAGADIHTFYYERISSIDNKKSFLSPELTISTNGKKALAFSCFSSDTLGNFLREYMEDSLNEMEKQSESQNELNRDLEKIGKIFELKEQGAISDEEYNTLKQKYINN